MPQRSNQFPARSAHSVKPNEDQRICLALAFNRNANHTDTLRIEQLEHNTDLYVISVSHNAEANSQDGPHHLDAKFGNRRFVDSLQDHFNRFIQQPMRVHSIVLE